MLNFTKNRPKPAVVLKKDKISGGQPGHIEVNAVDTIEALPLLEHMFLKL
ncbi:MAG: hypothetical protein AB1571_00480 [Nanoarchaeota archaeon]